MSRFHISQQTRRHRTTYVIMTIVCVSSTLVSGCHKTQDAAAATSNQALLQQQISDTEHDPSMSPEAKARYIQFLRDKLGGPPAAVPTKSP